MLNELYNSIHAEESFFVSDGLSGNPVGIVSTSKEEKKKN